jgi:2'-5' RNA ligase
MSGDATNPSRNPAENRSRGTLRTFIAIDLPTSILNSLAATQERLRSDLAGYEKTLRWSPTKNLHLTLRFLGDTTPHQCDEVTARLQEVAAQTSPFQLSLDSSGRGLGGFPNLRQPRVLWSGVGGDLEALARLQAQTEAVAQAIGFAPEEKSFSPHLTLARSAREADRRALQQVGQAIHDYAQQVTAAEVLSFEVDRLIFYQSELSAGGSRYTKLAELPFAWD